MKVPIVSCYLARDQLGRDEVHEKEKGEKIKELQRGV